MVTLLGKRLDKRMMGYCDSCRVLRLRYLFAVYWPLLRLIEALIEELSQLRVDTITPPEGLIHMLTVDRTCIVFFIDDLPYKGSNHTRPLYFDWLFRASHPICPIGQWLCLERLSIGHHYYCLRIWAFRFHTFHTNGKSL